MRLEFMLDTDTVSYALRGEGDVAVQIQARSPSSICVSAITVAELRFGADARKSRKIHHAIDAFLRPVHVLSFDAAAATQFGRVASSLNQAGTPIGELDAMIAAHAMVCGVTLVTNNMKHFSLVAGLRTENWLKKAV